MKRFADLTRNERAIEIVRWLCVPVATVLAAAVVIALASIALPPTMVQPPGTPPPPPPVIPRIVTGRAFNVLFLLAFVVAGAKTAPRARLAVAGVLSGLLIARAILYHIVVHLPGTPHYVDFGLTIAACAGATYLVYLGERGARPPGGASSQG